MEHLPASLAQESVEQLPWRRQGRPKIGRLPFHQNPNRARWAARLTRWASRRSRSIRRGLEEAVAYARGEAKESAYRVHVPALIDVRAIRTKLGMPAGLTRGSPAGSGSASTRCAIGSRASVSRKDRRAPTSPSSSARRRLSRRRCTPRDWSTIGKVSPYYPEGCSRMKQARRRAGRSPTDHWREYDVALACKLSDDGGVW
jgi:hypothetical protein